MTSSLAKNLEEAIRQAGEGWLIDSFAPPAKAIPYLREGIDSVHMCARQRLNDHAPDLSEAALVMAYNRDPLKVKAFFQVLGGSRTPEMLLMAWRIIQGMEIKDVQISYRRQQKFQLDVTLESPYGEPEEHYQSSKIQDFALFRHIGIMELGDRPVFEGFYALKIK